MPELIRFEFYRILKSKFIWVMAVLSALMPVLAAIGLVVIINLFGDNSDEVLDMVTDKSATKFFTYYVLCYFYERIPLLLALFVPLFIGRDYKDGVIRNKITAGHKRIDIFGSVIITQVAVAAALSIIYILSGIAAMACTPIGLNLNKGEMLLRILTLLLSLLATTVLFSVVSLLIKSRALTVVICIAFIFSFSIFSLLSSNFCYSRKTVTLYVEEYNEMFDDVSDSEYADYIEDRKLDVDDYINTGWYIGRPLFLLTNSSLGREFVSDFSNNSLISLVENDMFSYPKKISRLGYINSAWAMITGNYGAFLGRSYGFDPEDIDGAYVKFEQAEIEYNVKSIIWMAVYIGVGYALFRKKNIF